MGTPPGCSAWTARRAGSLTPRPARGKSPCGPCDPGSPGRASPGFDSAGRVLALPRLHAWLPPDVQTGPPPIRPDAPDSELATADVEVTDRDLLMALSGPPAAAAVAARAQGRAHGRGLRGDVIKLRGPHAAVSLAERVLLELIRVIARGHPGARRRHREQHPPAARSPGGEPGRGVPAGRGDRGAAAGRSRRAAWRSATTCRRSRPTTSCSASGPAGTGKTYLAMAMAVAALLAARQAHHPDAARGRGRREARLSARRHGREGQPVPAPALRRAARHAAGAARATA